MSALHHTVPSPRAQKAVVRFTYEAEDGNQLSLQQVGDIITIHSQDSEDWWDGEFNGVRGYLPAKYVELLAYSIPTYEAAATEMEPLTEKRNRTKQQSQLSQSVSLAGTGIDSASMYLSPSASAADFRSPLLESSDLSDGAIASQAFWSSNGDLTGLGSDDMDRPEENMFESDIGTVSSNSIFSFWSSSLGKLSGWVSIVTGALTLAMGLYNHAYFKDVYTFVGAYGMALGLLTVLYEVFSGRLHRKPLRLPFRSLAYGASMVPLLLAYPTRVAALLYVVVALVNLVAAARGESVETRPRRRDQLNSDTDGSLLGASHLPTSSSGASSSSSTSSKSHKTHHKDGPRASACPASFFTYFLTPSKYRSRRWISLLGLILVNLGAGAANVEWHVRDNTWKEWNVWFLIGRITAWMLLLHFVFFFLSCMSHFLRYLANLAERNQSPERLSSAWSKLTETLLSCVPPDPHQALMFFHHVLAGIVMAYSILHGLAHTLSFMLQPEQTLARYTYWCYTSGALLFVLLILIYSVSKKDIRSVTGKSSTPGAVGSSSNNNQGGNLLWRWIHGLYFPFFILLIFHAPQGFSILSIITLTLPMGLWILDRVWNYVTKRRLLLPVLSFHFIRPNVVRVHVSSRLAPRLVGAWTEGDWMYVNFPALGNTWTPVSIASAPQMRVSPSTAATVARGQLQPLPESAEELHNVEGGSFVFHLLIDSLSISSPTAKYLEYFQRFGPLGSSGFLLDEPGHRRAQSMGRVWDEHGGRIIRIDGPHASAVGHVTKYHSCMLVAPSTGIAAVASAMRSIMQHRWKSHIAVAGGLGDSRHQLGSGPGRLFTTPDVLFVVWCVEWKELDNFRWFVQTIKDCEDELFAMRDASSSSSSSIGSHDAFFRSKHFELHAFVSGSPAEDRVGGHGMSSAVQEEGFFGPSTLNVASGGDGADVPRGVAPASQARAPFSCVQLYHALKNPSNSIQRFSSVHVHRGAPSWGDIFQALNHRATGQTDIACIYTAGPLAAHLTPVGAEALREKGLVDVPSDRTIEAHHRTSEQLRTNCAHYAAQSGKRWRYHMDVDVQ